MRWKIHYITASPGHIFGGGKKVFFSLINGLDRTRFQPVVTCDPSGLYAEKLRHSGVSLCPLSMSSRYNVLDIFRLAGILRQESPHIVHSQGGGRSNFFAVLAAKMAKVPVILSTVATLVERWEDTPVLRRAAYQLVDRRVETMIDRFICVSEELRRALITGHGLENDRVVTVHNGIDLEGHLTTRAREDILNDFGLPPNALIISLLGRLVWMKGIDLFLEAAAEMIPSCPNCYFLIVGEGPLRNDLEKQAAAAGVSDRCIFTGFQQDIPAILKITDILAIPSHTEGLPMVILEAMAAGIPVVGSSIGGIPEMIIDGKNGYLIPRGNAKALAEKLSMLAADQSLRTSMGKQSRKLAESSFSEAAMIRKTEEIYLETLKRKGLLK